MEPYELNKWSPTDHTIWELAWMAVVTLPILIVAAMLAVIVLGVAQRIMYYVAYFIVWPYQFIMNPGRYHPRGVYRARTPGYQPKRKKPRR